MNDLISRQAAIDAFDKHLRTTDVPASYPGIISALTEWLNELPPVQPERKKGKWIRKSPTAWSWTCSCCKKDDAYAYSAGESFEPDVLQDLFCPNCGADMRGEQDETD